MALLLARGNATATRWHPSRPLSVPPRASIAQSPEEVFLGSQKLRVLDRAANDLVEFCSSVADEGDRARCWEVRCGSRRARPLGPTMPGWHAQQQGTADNT
mgnify:FL=1